MKQFNLEEYLKDPNRKIVTRDGRNVRIICTDRAGLNAKPIVALITLPNGDENVKTFWNNGFETTAIEGENDLFFAPEKHDGWLNIYRSDECGFYIMGNSPYESKEKADKVAKANPKTFFTTIKVEWEE